MIHDVHRSTYFICMLYVLLQLRATIANQQNVQVIISLVPRPIFFVAKEKNGLGMELSHLNVFIYHSPLP